MNMDTSQKDDLRRLRLAAVEERMRNEPKRAQAEAEAQAQARAQQRAQQQAEKEARAQQQAQAMQELQELRELYAREQEQAQEQAQAQTQAQAQAQYNNQPNAAQLARFHRSQHFNGQANYTKKRKRKVARLRSYEINCSKRGCIGEEEVEGEGIQQRKTRRHKKRRQKKPTRRKHKSSRQYNRYRK